MIVHPDQGRPRTRDVPSDNSTRIECMMPCARPSIRRALLCAALFVTATVRAAAGQGVDVAILPTGQTVTPGSTFTLQLQVTDSGAFFNGFDAVVTYDPAALTFNPTAPTSQQQGAYLLDACGNTFHVFNSDADSLSITNVLLCSGVSLGGPGTIYTLSFTASATPQTTHVRFRSIRFYESGLFVSPVHETDASIGIGVTVGVDPPGISPHALQLRAHPNPFRASTSIQITSPLDGTQRITVRDIQGRQVRRLQEGRFVSGTRRVQWDGRDDAGRPLPAGVYRITVHSRHAAASTLTALLR